MFFRYLASIVIYFALSFAAARASAFSICSEPENPPMSHEANGTKPAAGFEIEVAELLARELGEKLEIKWVAQRDHSYYRQTIGKGVCDAIMSVPVGFARLETTKSWYRSAYAFVSRNEKKLGLTSFDDPRLKKLSVAVPATGLGDTPPAMALVKRGIAGNLKPYSVLTPGEGLTWVVEGDVDVAIAPGPFAAWFADENNRAGRAKLEVTATPAADESIPLGFDIAIGVQKKNVSLKEKLDRAIEKHRGEILKILSKWHVPGGGT